MLKVAFLGIVLFSPILAKETLPMETVLPVREKDFFVDVGNAKLFCRVMGNGSPMIVIHGGPGGSHEYFLPHFNKLAKHHQVVFYDQRGSGESTGEISEKTINLPTFIEDLEKLRKALGFKKITLLGHSFGGFLAMNYAARYPKSVEKIVFMNTIGPTSVEFAEFLEECQRRMTPYRDELKEISESKSFIEGDSEVNASYIRTMFRTYCRNPQKAELLNLQFSPRGARNGHKTADLFQKTYFSRPYDISGNLSKISCPVLILHGDTDPIPLTTAAGLHKKIPNSQLVVLRECGHFPFVEQPDECFKALNKFLKD